MNKTRRCATQWMAVGALGICLVGVTRRAGAQDASPKVQPVQFGMMGAVQGEVVRLSVTNFHVPDSQTPPDPCHATLTLVDSHGDALRRPDGTFVTKTVNLLPGRSAFLQVHAGQLLGPEETRLDFRPVVLVEASTDPQTPPDPCTPSLEIIVNSTGQTRVFSTGVVPFGYGGK